MFADTIRTHQRFTTNWRGEAQRCLEAGSSWESRKRKAFRLTRDSVKRSSDNRGSTVPGRKWSWPNLMYYPSICLGWLRKTCCICTLSHQTPNNIECLCNLLIVFWLFIAGGILREFTKNWSWTGTEYAPDLCRGWWGCQSRKPVVHAGRSGIGGSCLCVKGSNRAHERTVICLVFVFGEWGHRSRLGYAAVRYWRNATQ